MHQHIELEQQSEKTRSLCLSGKKMNLSMDKTLWPGQIMRVMKSKISRLSSGNFTAMVYYLVSLLLFQELCLP